MVRHRFDRVDEIAGQRQCLECALRPTWKGNLSTLFVVVVILAAIFS
jgi:hypothetical protein